MSAVAPLPKPEPEPQTDADGWALLEGLRRRLDDQQISQRATQTQVTQLAESIGALVELQRRRVRGLNLNSFVAYLIFTMLCGAGAYLLFRSRASELIESRDRATTERDAATKRADDATAKLAARVDAEGRAWDVYQLLETGKRADAKAKLAALAGLPLSHTERVVLDARAHESQVSEVDAALKAAAASFKAGRYAEVVAPLGTALAAEPAGPRASQMRYYLGVAYAKAGELDKSIAMLTAVTDADQEDARFQLASALDRKGDFVRARAEYDRFATAHPQSPLAVFAMRRSATLAHPPAIPVIAPKPVAPAPVAPKAAAAPEPSHGEAMSTLALPAGTPVTSRAQELPGVAATARDQALPPTARAVREQALVVSAPRETRSMIDAVTPPRPKLGQQMPQPEPWLASPLSPIAQPMPMRPDAQPMASQRRRVPARPKAPATPTQPPAGPPPPAPPPQPPSPPTPPAAPSQPPTAPCNGNCIQIPQPPKAGPLPQPSPWLPPSTPEKPEPAPEPPAPQPAPEPRPFAM